MDERRADGAALAVLVQEVRADRVTFDPRRLRLAADDVLHAHELLREDLDTLEGTLAAAAAQRAP